MADEELKQIMKENKQTLDSLDQRLKRIEKRFVWSSVFGFIKILIIVAPLIVGVIYITPFLKDFFKIYQPVYQALPNLFQKTANTSGDSNVESAQADLMIESFCDETTRQRMIEQFCK
ncbi:MAG: hypothetical protein WCS88_00630 [Patescibacteria group bacterium]|jgi:hypothetical protein